jgi:flagellar assembly protein FliH
MAHALSEAQSIIEAAEQRARELSLKAETSYKEAKALGYEEGFKQGMEDASKKAVRFIQESTSIADRLAEEAAKLALAISSSVVREHICVSPETVKKIALGAIQESVVGDSVVLTVNPEDKTILESALGDIRRIAGTAGISIETSPTLSRGGCIVKTDFGEVDASIETMLECVKERLRLE